MAPTTYTHQSRGNADEIVIDLDALASSGDDKKEDRMLLPTRAVSPSMTAGASSSSSSSQTLRVGDENDEDRTASTLASSRRASDDGSEMETLNVDVETTQFKTNAPVNNHTTRS